MVARTRRIPDSPPPLTSRAKEALSRVLEPSQQDPHAPTATRLLLAVLACTENGASEVLRRLGIAAERVRALACVDVEMQLTRSEARSKSALSPLQAAVDCAIACGHAYLGTEHLLFGAVAAAEGEIATELASLGLGKDRIRDCIVALRLEVPFTLMRSHPNNDAGGKPRHSLDLLTLAVSAFRKATSSTREDAVALENAVVRNPSDVTLRARLIGHYYGIKDAQSRAPHVLWLIAHYPGDRLAGSPYTGFLNSDAEQEHFEVGARIWRGLLDNESVPADVWYNAATFLRGDPLLENLVRRGMDLYTHRITGSRYLLRIA